VVLLGRTAAKLEAVKAEVEKAGGTAVVAPCDVTDRNQVLQTIRTVLASVGALDILVCNAGINVPKRSLRSLDPADWDRVLATNLTGAFNLVHAVLPAMRDRGSGLVVQIASISAMRASTISGAAYSVSKFGQAALGICIGREERGRNIRSTVIYPGEADTGFLDARAARPGGGDNMRRQALLQPKDIAAVVRFVAELPPRAHIPELVIKPSVDDFS
jgi:NADP-dependent 3-hydroxy acid dehydrogenase YdfG